MFPLLLAQVAASPPVAGDQPTTFAGFVLKALVGLAGLAVTAAGAAAARWLASKGTQTTAFNILGRAFELATSVVAHIDAKVRPALLKDLDDGKLDPGERKALQDAALTALKDALGPGGVADLQKALGLGGASAIDTYLSGLLERALTALRGQQAAADVGSPANPSPAAVAAAVAKARP